jgi:hypothetical protein
VRSKNVHEEPLFASILLHEPGKQIVLKWTPDSAIDLLTQGTS